MPFTLLQQGNSYCLINTLFLQSVHLERLALYHDSDRLPWEIDKRWEDISPHEWIEVIFNLTNSAFPFDVLDICYCQLDLFISTVCDLIPPFHALVIFVLYQIFEDGINEPTDHHKLVSKWAMNRTYLVHPINANLQYHRLGNQERSDPEIPFEKISLVLTDISLTLTEVFSFQLFY